MDMEYNHTNSNLFQILSFMGILKTITFKYYFINTRAKINDTNENWTPNDLTHVFTEECLMQANFTALS